MGGGWHGILNVAYQIVLSLISYSIDLLCLAIIVGGVNIIGGPL